MGVKPAYLFLSFSTDFDAVSAVHFGRKRLELVRNWLRRVINRLEMARRFECVQDSLPQRSATFAAFAPDIVDGDAPAALAAMGNNGIHFGWRIRRERVDRDNDGDTDLADIRRMAVQVRQAALHRLDIFSRKLCFFRPAVHLKCPHRRNQHDGIGRERGHSRGGDNIAELLKA